MMKLRRRTHAGLESQVHEDNRGMPFTDGSSACTGGRLGQRKFLDRYHHFIEGLSSICGQCLCPFAEDIDPGDVDRKWGVIGEVEFVEEADQVGRHDWLGSGA